MFRLDKEKGLWGNSFWIFDFFLLMDFFEIVIGRIFGGGGLLGRVIRISGLECEFLCEGLVIFLYIGEFFLFGILL